MDDLQNFFDVLPFDNLEKTEKFAPFQAIRQSWVAADTLARGDSNWILGNFSNTVEGACESSTPSRISSRAVLFVRHAGVYQGKSLYVFIHS